MAKGDIKIIHSLTEDIFVSTSSLDRSLSWNKMRKQFVAHEGSFDPLSPFSPYIPLPSSLRTPPQNLGQHDDRPCSLQQSISVYRNNSMADYGESRTNAAGEDTTWTRNRFFSLKAQHTSCLLASAPPPPNQHIPNTLTEADTTFLESDLKLRKRPPPPKKV